MRTRLWVAAVIAMLSTQCVARVLLTDDFEDGNRDGWFKQNSDSTFSAEVADDTAGLGSGNALFMTVTGTAGKHLVANFNYVTLLNPGEMVQLRFDIRLGGTLVSNTGAFRVGLYDSYGTVVTEDETTAGTTDNDRGYFVRMATGDVAPTTAIFRDVTATTINGGTGIAQRGSTAAAGLLTGTGKTLVFTITKRDVAGLRFDVALDGEVLLNNVLTSDADIYTYNEVAFSSTSGVDFVIDTVEISTNVGDNIKPIVNAGGDRVLFMGETIQLSGTAMDYDGDPLTTEWSQLSGPGVASFAPDAFGLDPVVDFTAVGTYVLQLSAHDGKETATDSLTVIVRDPAEKALLGLWDFETLTPADPNVYAAVGANHGAWTSRDPNYTTGWITGASPNRAAEFFGDEYILIPDPNKGPDINAGVQYGITMACWAKVSAFDVSGARLVEKDGFSLARYSTTNQIKFVLKNMPSEGISGDISVNDGQWHHIAGVYDGSTMRLYIDGLLDRSAPAAGIFPVSTAPLTIGANNTGGAMFKGAIDDVRIYGYGMSDAEVAALAALGVNRVPRVEAVATSQTTIQLPVSTVQLDATLLDPDGDALTLAWTTASGPANAVFTAPDQAATAAEFTVAGRYTLRLTASDGTASVFDEIAVLVYPEGWNGELAHMPYDNQNPDDVTFWGYQATLHGTPSYSSPGKIGSGALELNGTNNYLTYDASLASDVTDLTFCTWTRANVAADMCIAGNWPNYVGDEQGWFLWYDDAGYFKLWLGKSFSGTTYSVWNMSTVTYNVGEWTHVALTFKKNATPPNTVKFYVNGQLKLDATTTYQVGPNPNVPFFVGRRPQSDQLYLNGAVDDLWLYNRVLDQQDIAALAGLNIPPVVDAGPQKKIILPTDSVVLNGSVTDTDPFTMQWTVAEGPSPAGVTFAPVDAAETTVTFPQAGDYLLRLTATDSFSAASSAVVMVKVRAEGFDGLEAYIPFESADPNAAIKSLVGMQYAGTILGDPNAGYSSTSAKLGAGALELAVNDRVTYSKFMGSDPAITVSVWFNCKDLVAGGRIIEKWPGNLSGRGWFMRVRGGVGSTYGNLAAMIGSAYNGPGNDMRAPLGTFNQDEWVHAVLTYQDGVARLYQNGALVWNQRNVPWSPGDTTSLVSIGGRLSTNAEYFNGLIDEVRIYDHALAVEQVKALYAAAGGQPWDTCPNTFSGDLNHDCRVDMDDIAVLSQGWQDGYGLSTLFTVAQTWLNCNSLDLSDCF